MVWHNKKEVRVRMTIVRRYKTLLYRQVGESVKINYNKSDIIMNSKGEFNGSKLPRIVIEIGEDVETEDYRNGMKEHKEREQKKSELRKREENRQAE